MVIYAPKMRHISQTTINHERRDDEFPQPLDCTFPLHPLDYRKEVHLTKKVITSTRPIPMATHRQHFQLGNHPHIHLTKLAQIHGPLISLRTGKRSLVVASSPTAASEVLKTHDSVLSGRNPSQTLPFHGSKFHKRGLVFSDDCDDDWRIIRNTYRKELFPAKALESQVDMREMIEFLGSKEGQVVRIRDIVFVASLNLLSNAFLSVDIVNFDGNGVGGGMMGQRRRLGEVVSSHQLSELSPIFGGRSLKSLYTKIHDLAAQVWAVWADDLKEKRKSDSIHRSGRSNFVDILIAKGFSDEEINIMLQELFSAGTETTSSTIEWVMVELLKNKEAMQKLRTELAQVTSGETIRESHLPHLPYLEACIKEVLRLHSAAPLLLPHRAVQTCEVMGYTIPKDSEIMVNVWAIARDPNIWDDPLSFKPEGYLGLTVDYRGQDFEYLPFGSGRRMCPGQPMASKTIPLIVASLIQKFEWFLPNNEDPDHIDMEEELDIAMHKKEPLCCVAKLRDQFQA